MSRRSSRRYPRSLLSPMIASGRETFIDRRYSFARSSSVNDSRTLPFDEPRRHAPRFGAVADVPRVPVQSSRSFRRDDRTAPSRCSSPGDPRRRSRGCRRENATFFDAFRYLCFWIQPGVSARAEGSNGDGGCERLTSGVAGVELVPELNLGLAEVPAQEHHASLEIAREIHQAESRILELDSELLELALIPIELARVAPAPGARDCSARLRESSARLVDATRSSSRIVSRHLRCCRTTSSTILRTSGSVRLAWSTVNSCMSVVRAIRSVMRVRWCALPLLFPRAVAAGVPWRPPSAASRPGFPARARALRWDDRFGPRQRT